MPGRHRFAMILGLALSVAAPAHAEEFPELTASYAADISQAIETSEYTMAYTGRVWRDGERVRMEVDADGERLTTIMRGDTGEIFLLEAESDTAYKRPLSNDTVGMLSRELVQDTLNPRFERRETLDGHEVLVFRVEGTNPMGHPTSGHLWVTPDGVLIRQVHESQSGGEATRVEIDLRNISRGAQDPALFELPAGTNVEDM